jgi:hypothetical protein
MEKILPLLNLLILPLGWVIMAQNKTIRDLQRQIEQLQRDYVPWHMFDRISGRVEREGQYRQNRPSGD